MNLFALFRSKFYIAIILLAFVFSIGVLGFRLYGGYTWIDAVYMTAITVTTVGFREVNPPNDNVKLFIIALIVSSVFIFAYSIAIITEYILTKTAMDELTTKRMKKKINQLHNHVIICGFGRNGKQAATKLQAYQRPFAIIEKDREIIKAHENNFLFIEGSATEDAILSDAGIARAAFLITTLPEDADNLFIVLSARQLNKKLTIISRASQETSQQKLHLAGADKVVMPDRIGGDHMASMVVLPDLVEFINNLSVGGENNMNLEEIAIDNLPATYKYKSLAELELQKQTGCTIIGYKKPGGIYIVNPNPETTLLPQSKLIVIGQPVQIKKLNEMFHIE